MFFVFDQRIPLAVTAEGDAFAEILHVVDVIHPKGVDDGKGDVFFQAAEDFRVGEFLFFVSVKFEEIGFEVFD